MFSPFIALFRWPMKYFLFFSGSCTFVFPFLSSSFFPHCSWKKKKKNCMNWERNWHWKKKKVIFSSFSQFMQFLFFDCPLHRIIFSLCLIYLAFFCLHGSPLYCVIFSWRVICYLKFILRYYHKLYIFYISVRVERERLSIPPCYFQLLYYLTPKVLIFYISVLNFFFLALMLIVKYWDMKEKVINNKKRENIWDYHAYFD